MSEKEFLFQFVWRAAHGFHQDEEVIDKVGSLIKEPALVSIHRFDDGFCGFLSHFLRNRFRSFDEKTGCVGPVGHCVMSFPDEPGEGTQESFAVRSVETSRGPAMAGRPGR